MTGGAVSHIRGASGNHNRVGNGWDDCGLHRFTVPIQTFSKSILMHCGNLFSVTYKFRSKTKSMNEMKTSEHDMSNRVC